MTISTHILDAVAGHPAVGVSLALSTVAPDGSWQHLEAASTDADGRFLFTRPTPTGVYRLTFATGRYFAARSVETFYPEVTVTVTVEGDPPRHYHVPLLLSPYAYSTYRGS